jgi:hypothetical protein
MRTISQKPWTTSSDFLFELSSTIQFIIKLKKVSPNFTSHHFSLPFFELEVTMSFAYTPNEYPTVEELKEMERIVAKVNKGLAELRDAANRIEDARIVRAAKKDRASIYRKFIHVQEQRIEQLERALVEHGAEIPPPPAALEPPPELLNFLKDHKLTSEV